MHQGLTERRVHSSAQTPPQCQHQPALPPAFALQQVGESENEMLADAGLEVKHLLYLSAEA